MSKLGMMSEFKGIQWRPFETFANVDNSSLWDLINWEISELRNIMGLCYRMIFK